MKIKQIHPHLTQVTQTFLFRINAFLVQEDDGLTLVDTCFRNATLIIGAAEQINLPIKRIVLTHADDDHVGSLDALVSRLGKVEILISERESRVMSGDKKLDATEKPGKRPGSFLKTKAKPTRLLQVGDTIGSLTVLDNKGHAPGQIALWDDRSGTLIAGDTFHSIPNRLDVVGDSSSFFRIPGWSSWHLPTLFESARKLAKLQPKYLAMGHGETLANPAKALSEAIRRIESKN